MKKLLSVLLTLVMLVPAFGSFPVIASAENAVAQVVDSNGNATDYQTFEAVGKKLLTTERPLSFCRTGWCRAVISAQTKAIKLLSLTAVRCLCRRTTA